MGYDAYAYAVVGVHLFSDDVVKKSRVKAFKHNYPETMKFCPETGKELWREEHKFVNGGDIWECFDGLDVVTRGSEDRPDEPGQDLFIGRKLECEMEDEDIVFWSLEEIQKIKEEVRTKLSPYGLWNEEEFGVYPVLYESC